MKILEIRISAYRSLLDVTLAPSALTVLVGPNNSGKSNIVDALDFLGEVYRHGLELAISRRGGYENIAYRAVRRTKRPILFTVVAEIDPTEFIPVNRARRSDAAKLGHGVLRIRHSFSIRTASGAITADFSVVEESVDVWDDVETLRNPMFTIARQRADLEVTVRSDLQAAEREYDSIVYPMNNANYREFLRQGLTTTALLTGSFTVNTLLRQFVGTMGQTRLYQLTPIECRHPGVPTPNADLERHGGNLPAFVRYMQTQHRGSWRSVLAAMRRVVPNLEDIETTYTTDRRLALQFKERELPRPWTADEVSDGTVQSLALFAALFDPRAPVALIEEPENSVHPWILRNFVDACRNAHEKQIIVTTHSPALLSYLDPKEVAVVWKDGGSTHVKKLMDFDTLTKTLGNGYGTVYDLLDSGLLKEAVPAPS